MSILKKISKKPWGIRVIAKVVESYVRFVWLTSRWRRINTEYMEEAWETNTPILGVFWHSRLLMMLQSWRGPHRFHMLMSNHSDGKIMIETAKAFGFGCVAGSTNRNSAIAARALVQHLQVGESAGITPDGPRGPRYRVSSGTIGVARLANVDVHPVACSAKRGIFLRSWDRFFLPFPFNSGVYVCAEPVRVKGSKRSDEDLRLELERKLNEVTRKADVLCGHLDPKVADVPLGDESCESFS